MINETLKILMKEESYAYVVNNYSSIRHLLNASELEILSIPGVGPSAAKKLKAILELSQELLRPDENKIHIKKPQDVYDHLKYMSLFAEENLALICLNTKSKVIYSGIISKGTLNASLVHPREIFSPAIKERAASIIVAHNHPSSDCTPSQEDINITKRLKECGRLIGIELIDHVIIGSNKYFSMKEGGHI